MSNNIEQLKEAILDYQKIFQCKRRIVVVKKELNTQSLRLLQLKEIVKKEYQDVLLLEQFSLKQLFSTLLVNKEVQLEKERQEYLLAALNYNECQELVELLRYEEEILNETIQAESIVVKKFESALEGLQIKNEEDFSDEILLLKQYNQELKNLIKLKVESKEAYEVIIELRASFNIILDLLKQAKLYDNWGEFYKQRQIAKVKHKQYIDRAQEQVYRVRKQFIFLRSELLDIEQFKNSISEVRDLISDFNLHYYNDLITDWINVLKLDETLNHTLTTFDTVSKIGDKLQKLIINSDEEYQNLIKRRAALIEKIAD